MHQAHQGCYSPALKQLLYFLHLPMFYNCGTDKSETLTFYWLLYRIEIMAGNTLIQIHHTHTHYNYTSEKFWQKLIWQSLRQIAKQPNFSFPPNFQYEAHSSKGKLQHLT